MTDSHHHSHSHNHGHSHVHGPKNHNFAFVIGVGINTVFVLAELWFGYMANSLALISDAVHNASDVLGLLIAWGGIWLATRKPTERHTYGFGRGAVLASLLNISLLFASTGWIFVEGAHRLVSMESVTSATVIWVAVAGIFVNTLTALLFMRGREHDINIRGAFLHMAVDAGVSFGVVIAWVLMMFTKIYWIDGLVSIVISLIVIGTTWSILNDSLDLALDAVPRNLDRDEVEQYLKGLPGVVSLHDLHIWPINATHTGLTVHLQQLWDAPISDSVIQTAIGELRGRFGIAHPTLQTEWANIECVCDFSSS